jgi:hypothetical protein
MRADHAAVLAPAAPLRVLVVYAAYTTRSNLLDSLYSLRRFTRHRVAYLNIAARRMPGLVARQPWDLIVFHTLFFSRKFDREQQLALFDRVMPLAANTARKVLTPQDEFVNSDIVCDFARRIGAHMICSVQPPAAWPAVYGALDGSGIRLRGILTGYLDRDRVAACARFLTPEHRRPIDVGYRTIGKPVPWFGRHGFLKQTIAQAFTPALAAAGLRHDISTEDRDALASSAWYDFLGRCRYTLGVEGGTSILDQDGSIRRRSDAFQREHPDAAFEQIEAAAFPGVDGSFAGFAVSPRHLEACMTGTCQILTEGEYSGVLQPNVHYIPVTKDLSNVDAVVRQLGDEALRRRIVDNAYRDIVLSGRYSIERYPEAVIGDAAERPLPRPLGLGTTLKMALLHALLWLLDAADRLAARAWVGFKIWRLGRGKA